MAARNNQGRNGGYYSVQLSFGTYPQSEADVSLIGLTVEGLARPELQGVEAGTNYVETILRAGYVLCFGPSGLA